MGHGHHPGDPKSVKNNPVYLLLIALAVASCAGNSINIPAIEGGTTERQLPGKIIWHELLTDTPAETERFYSGLFGWKFESLPDPKVNYRLIRHRGRAIGGMIDETRLPTRVDISQWVSLISVLDIEADSQGALFALLQTRDGDPGDDSGVPSSGDFLWDELWTGDIERAATFYSGLAPYRGETRTLDGAESSYEYLILSSAGQKRLGVRENPVENLPPLWVNYLRVADEDELAEILGKVESLGGDILVPAVSRPGGGAVAIIAGPSGAGIALQTWGDEQKIPASRETAP
jgi:uncharacterized protein